MPCIATEQCVAGPELRTVFSPVTLRAVGKQLIPKVNLGVLAVFCFLTYMGFSLVFKQYFYVYVSLCMIFQKF